MAAGCYRKIFCEHPVAGCFFISHCPATAYLYDLVVINILSLLSFNQPKYTFCRFPDFMSGNFAIYWANQLTNGKKWNRIILSNITVWSPGFGVVI